MAKLRAGVPKFRIAVKHTFHAREVAKAVAQGSRVPLLRAGAMVEREAKMSMQRGGKIKGAGGKVTQVPSAPGTPPNVQSGDLRGSITFAYRKEQNDVIVGPTIKSKDGVPYGKIHEYGGRFHPIRAFMVPGLLKARSKFPALWRGLQLGRTAAGRKLKGMR